MLVYFIDLWFSLKIDKINIWPEDKDKGKKVRHEKITICEVLESPMFIFIPQLSELACPTMFPTPPHVTPSYNALLSNVDFSILLSRYPLAFISPIEYEPL